MPCIIAACENPATHNVGVRLRRPSTRAIWAPNTPAYLCDHHATQGLRITVILEPVPTHQIETVVSSPGGGSVSRRTPIRRLAHD